MPPLAFGGQLFEVAGRTALFWPARAALIVADLHLEKASWFATHGQMLPPYDSIATLSRVALLVKQTGAREMWCLGDNFHDNDGAVRLEGAARVLLTELAAGVAWHWITGNHDFALTDRLGGTVLEEAEVGGLILRHRAEAGEARPELSGHYHPKYRASARGRRVSRPCFVRSEHKLIFPAFGALTGGLAANHPEIMNIAGLRPQALVPTEDRLLAFNLRAGA